MSHSPPSSTMVWPPPPPDDETEAERDLRFQREHEAKQVSDRIDQALEEEKGELRKRRPDTKVLLLGQAESGKSTIMKNFELHFSPSTFRAEMEAWRAVIYLNLCRSVNFILDLLQGEPQDGPAPLEYTDGLRRLKIKLSPLRNVEETLSKRLSVDQTHHPPNSPRYNHDRASEVSIRSGSKWKCLLKSPNRRGSNHHGRDDLDGVRRVVEACRDDMMELWDNPTVQTALTTENISLHEQSGFFLSEVARVASHDYQPTPDDILRARIKTIGVEEYRIRLETVASGEHEWVIYDVPGTMRQRAVWAPFFDDVNVVIFLAPISAFNQALAEDKTVNRLMDTFDLWKQICTNKLLAQTQIILLLNKWDLLDAKLKSGIKFSKYVMSYSKANTVEAVSKYLLGKFDSLHKQYTPAKRKIHMHLTCAIDTHATAIVLGKIQEVILVDNLKKSELV